MRGRALCWVWCWAIGIPLNYCATAPTPSPSPERPRIGCYLSCADGRRPLSVIQRQCVGGARLRGKDISINGEEIDEQSPHQSSWLAGKKDERGKYLKDDVVYGTCTAFFIAHGATDEHQIGYIYGSSAEKQ